MNGMVSDVLIRQCRFTSAHLGAAYWNFLPFLKKWDLFIYLAELNRGGGLFGPHIHTLP